MEDSFDFEVEIDTKDALRRASLKADGLSTTPDSASTRGRHSIVCKHWLRNLCMKGEKCDFLHQYDPNRMPECTFWLKFGKCSDPACNFRHVADNERPECQRYRLGFCRYGLMCRSRHSRLPRGSLPELLPDWFLHSLIVNSFLIPRSEDLPKSDFRDQLRNGSRTAVELDLALTPAGPSLDQGTIPGLPPPIHGKCRFFVMRSMNVQNIQISAAKGIWASGTGNSQKLRQAFRDVDHVILIWSATESRTFSGFGKMMSEPDDMLYPGVWGHLSSRLSANFRVHWIKQCSTPLGLADHIKNPQNDDTPVRRCRDGQELPSSVGEMLCRFLWQQPEVLLVKGSDYEFGPRVSYEYPPAVPKDASAAVASAKAGSALAAAAPLALEDGRKDDERVDDSARPAPVPLGTFQRDARQKLIGKALASRSSSLMAAMAEDANRHSNYGGGGSPLPGPALPGWPSSPLPAGAWRPPAVPAPCGHWPGMPGSFGPPGGYFPPPPGSFGPIFPYPGPPPGGGPPMVGPPGAYGEAQRPPPGCWVPGQPPPLGGGERMLGRPPTDWEGASSSVLQLQDNASGRKRNRRSRSRRRKR